MTRPQVRFIAGLSAMLLLAGCFAIGWRTTYSSVPTLEPSETWSQTGDDTFAAPGMKLSVSAYNTVVGQRIDAALIFVVPLLVPTGGGSKPGPRPFKILVRFDPADGAFTFDPGRVRLASATLRPMAPSDLDACETPGAERPIQLESRLCGFWLIFDIEALDPDREFTLLLDGLARSDVPVPPLRIRFKPSRHTTVLDHFP